MALNVKEERNHLEDNDKEKYQQQENDDTITVTPTTPLHRSLLGTTGTFSDSPVITNCKKCDIKDIGLTKKKRKCSIIKNLRGRFSKIVASSDDTTTSTSGSSSEDGETGETGLPIIVSSSKFSTPTKKFPFFQGLNGKKRKKKLYRRISEISWGQKVEALLVCVAAFMSMGVIIGFIASLSIYLVEFKQAFSASHGLITLAVFLPTGVFGSVGLLSGIFLNKFGVRITGIIGSLLLGIGVGACTYANSVIFLFVFLGLFAGTGCSFVYLSLTMGVCSYFKNSRRLLMPLVTMGESIGTILFPLLTSYLIDIFFWRGSLLMMSGVMLQALVCAFMYSVKNLHQSKSEKLCKKQKTGKSIQINQRDIDNLQTLSDPSLSIQNKPTYNETDFPSADQPKQHHVKDLEAPALMIPNSKPGNANKVEGISKISVNGLNVGSQKVEALDVTRNTQGKSLLDQLSNLEPEANIDLDSNTRSEDKNIPQWTIFLSIVTDKQYVLFLISVFVISGCINTTLTVLPDFCVSQGLTLSQGAKVYAIGATGDAIARIIGGWLLFRNQLSSLMIFALSGLMTGLLTAIYPFLSKIYLICVLSFFVMLHSGLLFSVYNVVVLDFFDLKSYAIAMGLSETMAGIGVVIFGYIVGLVTEYYEGDYTVSFYLLAAMSVACMLPLLILFLYKRKKVAKIS